MAEFALFKQMLDVQSRSGAYDFDGYHLSIT